jgi:hypothetical protein
MLMYLKEEVLFQLHRSTPEKEGELVSDVACWSLIGWKATRYHIMFKLVELSTRY